MTEQHERAKRAGAVFYDRMLEAGRRGATEFGQGVRLTYWLDGELIMIEARRPRTSVVDDVIGDSITMDRVATDIDDPLLAISRRLFKQLTEKETKA